MEKEANDFSINIVSNTEIMSKSKKTWKNFHKVTKSFVSRKRLFKISILICTMYLHLDKNKNKYCVCYHHLKCFEYYNAYR